MTSSPEDDTAARFRGASGKRHLIDLLRRQPIFQNSGGAIEHVARIAKIKEFKDGESIVKQDGTDTDIYFILIGKVILKRNDREINRLSDGTHFGEFPAIHPKTVRFATIKACERTVLASVSEAEFSKVANKYPIVWRELAKELVSRLSFVSRAEPPRRTKTCVFIASASEDKAESEALAKLLKTNVDVEFWDDNIFTAGLTNIEAIESIVPKIDFAVLVISAVDQVISKGNIMLSPRDNLILELGFFVGALSRQRAIVVQRDGLDLKIPTDFAGVNTIKYRTDINEAEIGLQSVFDRLGPI